MYAAKRTAAFLRLLAQELVPQNKLAELVMRMDDCYRLNSLPEDFTGAELQMARTIGLDDDELEQACGERLLQLRHDLEKEQKKSEACSLYWQASEDKASGYRLANMHLEQAFKRLGVVPEVPETKT